MHYHHCMEISFHVNERVVTVSWLQKSLIKSQIQGSILSTHQWFSPIWLNIKESKRNVWFPFVFSVVWGTWKWPKLRRKSSINQPHGQCKWAFFTQLLAASLQWFPFFFTSGHISYIYIFSLCSLHPICTLPPKSSHHKA